MADPTTAEAVADELRRANLAVGLPEDSPVELLIRHHRANAGLAAVADYMAQLRSSPSALTDLMGGGAVVLLPCPNGCGCVMPEDADVHECACDGPCCMGSDDEWPIRFVPNREAPDAG